MNEPTLDPSHLAAIAVPLIFLCLVASVVAVIPYWFIFKKAGFSPWLAVLMFVPLANIIILYVIAFSEWKVAPVAPYSVTPISNKPYPPQT